MKLRMKMLTLAALATTMALPTITTFAASTPTITQQQAECRNAAQGENGDIAKQHRYGQLDTATNQQMHCDQHAETADTQAGRDNRQAKQDGTGQMKRNGEGPKSEQNDCLSQK